MTHICVSKLTIIGSYNGLLPGRRQATIWTNDGKLLIQTLGTNFSEILSEIHTFSFKKMHLNMSFCLNLNVLVNQLFSQPLLELRLEYCGSQFLGCSCVGFSYCKVISSHLHIAGPLWRNRLVNGGFPAQGACCWGQVGHCQRQNSDTRANAFLCKEITKRANILPHSLTTIQHVR